MLGAILCSPSPGDIPLKMVLGQGVVSFKLLQNPKGWIKAAAAAKLLQSCLTLCDPIDSSPLGSLSLGFSRQEHWSELPFPSPMYLSKK